MTYRGYNGTLSVEGDVLVLTHEGAMALLAGLPTNVPRRIPLASISDAALHASSMLTNGWLAVGSTVADHGLIMPDRSLGLRLRVVPNLAGKKARPNGTEGAEFSSCDLQAPPSGARVVGRTVSFASMQREWRRMLCSRLAHHRGGSTSTGSSTGA
jgi:hypothetical protein